MKPLFFLASDWPLIQFDKSMTNQEAIKNNGNAPSKHCSFEDQVILYYFYATGVDFNIMPLYVTLLYHIVHSTSLIMFFSKLDLQF